MTLNKVCKEALREESGFTLLQLLFMVGVIAILVASVFGVYRIANTDARVMETVRVVYSIKGHLKRVFRADNGYGTGTLLPMLDATGGFPKTVKVSLPTAIHPLGGPLDVFGNVGGGSFTIRLDGLDHGTCAKLGSNFSFDTERELMGIDISINGGAPASFDVNTGFSMAILGANCGGPGDVVTFDLIFA